DRRAAATGDHHGLQRKDHPVLPGDVLHHRLAEREEAIARRVVGFALGECLDQELPERCRNRKLAGVEIADGEVANGAACGGGADLSRDPEDFGAAEPLRHPGEGGIEGGLITEIETTNRSGDCHT
ncbi:MAG TPA: hypothetical protein VNM87_07530, partial [Candidatus Udaeobacter sp.]|nr:hypothetical protein [Candidatus Udaeobacter sp.]